MTIYQQMLDVNTLGPVRVTKAFLPLLREAEGRVVVVASVAGEWSAQSTFYKMKELFF